MLNILIPLGGKSSFFDSDEYPFPKPIIEIDGKPMIELVLKNYLKMKREKRFIFIIKREDCTRYHIDNVLKLLTHNNCTIIYLDGDTKGAACSALLAIDHINNSDPLIITNGDQIIDAEIDGVLENFEKHNADGGVICFESVHPKWSYVRLDKEGKIVETAEKRPISNHAIAGFYYFQNGSTFINAAMESIQKDASVDGVYFIAPTFNEFVLANKNLHVIHISSDKYHSFYSPQKIKEYENYLTKMEIEASKEDPL